MEKKRVVCLLLVLFLFFSLSSCESSNTYDDWTDEDEYDEIEDDYDDYYDEDDYDEDEEDDVIPWDEAGDHIGEYATVYGPVVGTNYASSVNGQPTFLDIGEDYPSQNRVTILIWGDNRSSFSHNPEDYYYLQNVKVTGEISTYNGAVQIEAYSDDDIEIVG